MYTPTHIHFLKTVSGETRLNVGLYLLYGYIRVLSRPIFEATNGTCQLCALTQRLADHPISTRRLDRTFESTSVYKTQYILYNIRIDMYYINSLLTKFSMIYKYISRYLIL